MERIYKPKYNWRRSNVNIKPVDDNQNLHDALHDFRKCMKLEMDKIRTQIRKVTERELEMIKLREFSIQSLEQLRKDIHQTIDNNANLLQIKGKDQSPSYFNVTSYNQFKNDQSLIVAQLDRGSDVDKGDSIDKGLSGLKSKANENLVYLLQDRIESLEKTLKEKEDVIEFLKENKDNKKIRFRVT